MTNITWLRGTDTKDFAQMGSKAYVTAQLAAAEFPIADGFVLHPTVLVNSLIQLTS